MCICACEAVLSFCCLLFFYLLILNQISSSLYKFGEISHNVPIPLYVVQKHKCRKQGKWENLLIIDEPIWDSVQSNRRGLCPNISTTKWRACPCCSTATNSDSPLVSLFFIHPRAHIKKLPQHSRLTSSLMKSAAECTYTQRCEE